MVVNSDGTSDWLRAAAQATAAALPNGWGVELPGSWHRINMDVLGQVLAKFATSLYGGATSAERPAGVLLTTGCSVAGAIGEQFCQDVVRNERHERLTCQGGRAEPVA
jgi:hypothetical protein